MKSKMGQNVVELPHTERMKAGYRDGSHLRKQVLIGMMSDLLTGSIRDHLYHPRT